MHKINLKSIIEIRVNATIVRLLEESIKEVFLTLG